MGRAGETVRRTFAMAGKMKAELGALRATPTTTTTRVLRYIAKLTINPAIAHGLSHEIGSPRARQAGRHRAVATRALRRQAGAGPQGRFPGLGRHRRPQRGDRHLRPLVLGPQFGGHGATPAELSVAFVAGRRRQAGGPAAHPPPPGRRPRHPRHRPRPTAAQLPPERWRRRRRPAWSPSTATRSSPNRPTPSPSTASTSCKDHPDVCCRPARLPHARRVALRTSGPGWRGPAPTSPSPTRPNSPSPVPPGRRSPARYAPLRAGHHAGRPRPGRGRRAPAARPGHRPLVERPTRRRVDAGHRAHLPHEAPPDGQRSHWPPWTGSFNGWGAQDWATWEHDAKIGAARRRIWRGRARRRPWSTRAAPSTWTARARCCSPRPCSSAPSATPTGPARRSRRRSTRMLGTRKAIWLRRGLTARLPSARLRHARPRRHRGRVRPPRRGGRPTPQPDPTHPDHELCKENVALLRATRRTRGAARWRSSNPPPRPSIQDDHGWVDYSLHQPLPVQRRRDPCAPSTTRATRTAAGIFRRLFPERTVHACGRADDFRGRGRYPLHHATAAEGVTGGVTPDAPARGRAFDGAVAGEAEFTRLPAQVGRNRRGAARGRIGRRRIVSAAKG